MLVKLFHLILTFYVVQTAERVCVIVMWREINLCLHTQSADSKLGRKATMITRLSRNQKQNKRSVFSWMHVF